MTITDIPAAPPGTGVRTDWEREQYQADHGATAALALGFLLLAKYVKHHAAGDMQILGRTAMPEPPPYKFAVFGGTDDEQKARIDAWAKRHGVTAHTDRVSGHYEAAVPFGPVRLVAYMVPERVMADRVQAENERREAIRAAAGEVLAGIRETAPPSEPELAVAAA
jgi:hypothetical protein